MREFVLDKFLEAGKSKPQEEEDTTSNFKKPKDRMQSLLSYIKKTGVRLSIINLALLDSETTEDTDLIDLIGEEETIVLKELRNLNVCQIGSEPLSIKKAIPFINVCRMVPTDFKYYTLIEEENEDEGYIVFFFNDPRVLQCIDFEM